MSTTYTAQERDRFRKFGDLTPNGIVFDWWLVNINGAGFALIREPHHTDADIAAAKDYLHRQRDVVGSIRVAHLAESETT